MDRRTVFEASVSRPSASTAVGVVAALAITAAVFLGINLWVGEDRLPRELEGTTPWFAAATAGLSAVTFGLWWRSRRRLRVVEVDGRQVLEIDDRPPVLIEGPFTIRTGWSKVAQPKGPALTQLHVVFVDGDRVPLVLTEFWGAIYGAPPWPQEVLAVQGEAVYSPAGRAMLVPLVEALETR